MVPLGRLGQQVHLGPWVRQGDPDPQDNQEKLELLGLLDPQDHWDQVENVEREDLLDLLEQLVQVVTVETVALPALQEDVVPQVLSLNKICIKFLNDSDDFYD